MDLELTHEQQQLESEIYDYLKQNLTNELRQELDVNPEGEGPLCRQFMKQLGRDGWMGIGWPKEYGGQGRSAIEQYIFFDLAMGYFRIPLPVLSLMTVGPTLMLLGTDEQKREYLPRILSNDVVFAIAYSEPEAGTDLFSLKTTAVPDGDDYIINGQKIFTTWGHVCDYFWIAARTDPRVERKHKGISIFLIDAKSPGISIEPMWLMGEYRVNVEFFDNVRVPKKNLIGEENKGFQYMLTQLAHERIAMVPHSAPQRHIGDVTTWAQTKRYEGAFVIDQPWVRNKLAEMTVETEVLKILNYRVAWMISQGVTPHVESAMIKVFGTEQIQRVFQGCLEILGQYGQLKDGSGAKRIVKRLQRESQSCLQMTFAGGANEVLRDSIAMLGLGLMKSR
ncbi:MAG: acyl-CoA dehydrogenase family protein [Chloroflexi bacterium]|nr:acyl-CoA dehydrogenase family protein [Chloroflexota bacterium]